jgi:2'-5' RNA ligase
MLREHEETDFGPTVVDQVVIFSSELFPTGPVYEAMGHVELKG